MSDYYYQKACCNFLLGLCELPIALCSLKKKKKMLGLQGSLPSLHDAEPRWKSFGFLLASGTILLS